MIYGDKWIKKFDGELFENNINILLLRVEWYNAIKNFSNKTIGLAIDYSRDNFKWPPSIAEFVKLCKEAQNKFKFEENLLDTSLIKKKKSQEEIKRQRKIAEKYLKICHDKLHPR